MVLVYIVWDIYCTFTATIKYCSKVDFFHQICQIKLYNLADSSTLLNKSDACDILWVKLHLKAFYHHYKFSLSTRCFIRLKCKCMALLHCLCVCCNINNCYNLWTQEIDIVNQIWWFFLILYTCTVYLPNV